MLKPASNPVRPKVDPREPIFNVSLNCTASLAVRTHSKDDAIEILRGQFSRAGKIRVVSDAGVALTLTLTK